MKHGTRSMYVHRNCRCKPCVDANRTYSMESSQRRRLTRPLPSTILHGKRSTYINWGCRCDLCTRVHVAACREYEVRTGRGTGR